MDEWPFAARLAAALIVGGFGSVVIVVGLALICEYTTHTRPPAPRVDRTGRPVWGGRR